jgi:hypothetical protein
LCPWHARRELYQHGGNLVGSVVSPIRANVSVPSALDRWCETVVQRHGHGAACLLRSAVEDGCACAPREDAARCDTVLGQRVRQGGRERSGDTTRRRPCRRRPAAAPTRCELLGCACHGGKDRAGTAPRTRRTSRQQFRHALTRGTAWWKAHRPLRLRVVCARRPRTLRGSDHDDGVHGQTASLLQGFHSARRRLRPWLKRRRQRRGSNGHGSQDVLQHCKVERPRMVGRPRPKKAVLMAYANLRQRVGLQSPVREHRTPGSVRGRSGNWPSSRDGPAGGRQTPKTGRHRNHLRCSATLPAPS